MRMQEGAMDSSSTARVHIGFDQLHEEDDELAENMKGVRCKMSASR